MAATLLCLLTPSSEAVEKSGQRQHGANPLGSPAATLSNINNISVWLRDDGWGARDPETGNSGLTFPRQTATAVFQHGVLWGGNVNDGRSPALRVGGQTYSIGTARGRMISRGVPENPTNPGVRIYRVRPDYAAADLILDAAEINHVSPGQVTQQMINLVRAQYQTDWAEWPATYGAPFVDVDQNGVYNPTIDTPGITNASQTVWFVANDLDSARTSALYGSPPIGLEMQVTVWAYSRVSPPYSSVIFKRDRVIYKGTLTTPANATITDMYLTQWVDPDVGNSVDDFAGCDTALGLAFGYNATATDANYAAFGLLPPAIGYDMVQGPIIHTGNPSDSAIFDLRKRWGYRNLPVSAAIYFAAGGSISDPPFTYQGTIQWYNLMQGLIPTTGLPFIHPRVPGVPTKFWLDGDPITGTGRIDGIISGPSDRRIALSAGPFTMALGDTQEVVEAIIAGLGTDYLNSVTRVKSYSAIVQNDYNGLLQILTSAAESGNETPATVRLEQNYPNPFNPNTTISYQLSANTLVSLKVFDILGREITTLVNEVKTPGRHSVTWNAANFSSGVYFCRFATGAHTELRTMVLIK
jgi:hypothetical protein